MTSPVFLLKRESVLSLVIASVVQVMSQSALAAPEGGQVVAGQAVIEQAEKETRIQQASERLSIDWKNFDINSDERVQFIQPTNSSIAFNRILSNKGSLIQGRIDANGQVVLINPNGLIFTEGASVNAGGLIASALQMNDQDYLNGKFTLNALEGSEGRVINSGLLNAATGGNISLLGQSVENKGLISAQLGSVNLAAGKEAVLTFEPNGLVGVRVTEAVLQKDLGVDAAVINSGEIKAEGGKVLITASTSKDIFSQAVNAGELSSAKSALVNADGSFTLGAGADINNTGAISVAAEGTAGEAVIIGENITNEGVITADSQTAKAGSIEISANSTNETKNNGKVSAVAHNSGQGGDIKLLGDKVGLLGQAQVDASGANGGGQVLLGGDKTGANPKIKNAQFLYVGDKTQVQTDATQTGEGGRLIAFAEDTARIYGSLSARGGFGGHGGFVETSGLKGFDFYRAPDLSSLSGIAGEWLIDPNNVIINNTGSFDPDFFDRKPETNLTTYTARSDAATIGWGTLLGAGIANVLVKTTDGDITFQNSYYFSVGGTKASSITFDAKGVIKFNAGLVVDASKVSAQPNADSSDESLSLTFNAGGGIDFNNTQFHTNGGSFTAKATAGNISSTGTIKTERPTVALDGATQSGAISITADAGQATFNNISSAGFSFSTAEGDGGNAGRLEITAKQGVIITGLVSSAGGLGKDEITTVNSVSSAKTGGHANSLIISSSDGAINIAKLSADGGNAGYDTLTLPGPQNANPSPAELNTRRSDAAGGNAGEIKLTASKGDINLTDTVSNKFGSGTKDLGFVGTPNNGKNGNGADFTLTAKNITTAAIVTNANEATFEATETVNLGNLNTQLAKTDCGDGLCRGDLLIKTAAGDNGISVGQSAGWTLRGNTQLTLGAQGIAILSTGANQFSLAGKTLSVTAKAATLGSNFALSLKNVSVEDLTLFSILDIGQEGTGSVVATNSTRLTGKSILLNNANNNFNQIELLTATDNAEVTDTDALTVNVLTTPKLAITSSAAARLNGQINTQNAAVEITKKGVGALELSETATKIGTGEIRLKTTDNAVTFNYTGAQTATWDLNNKTLNTNNTQFKYDGFATLIGGSGNDIFNLGDLITPPKLSGGSNGTDELHINENNNAANNWNVTVVKTAQDFTNAQSGLVQVMGLDKILIQNAHSSATPQLTLIDDGISTWTLTSASSEFKVQNTNLGGDIAFSGFKQLNGGVGQDIFNYSGAGNTAFIGNLDAGAGTADDKISGFNADTNWDLTGIQANFYRTAASAQKVYFKNIKTLTGGDQKDVITLSTEVKEVNLSEFSSGFTLENFEGITATANNAKLTGYTANSIWNITADKKGTITSNGKTTEFVGFSELVSAGGTNADKFTFDANGSVAKVTGQTEDELNARTGINVTNNWLINSDGTAQVGQQNGNANTIYIGTITGVGTVNGSIGADKFIAQGTYANAAPGTQIKARFSTATEDANTLTTAAADIVFNNVNYTSNGIVGITEFKADGAAAVLKVSSPLGAVDWQLVPGAASQLSGTVKDVATNQSLGFTDFATLIGGDNNDTFTLGTGTFTGGAINAGGGDNRLINTVTNAAWNLHTNTVRTVNFAGIQKLTALDGDTLTAANANNTFTFGVNSVELLNQDTNTTYTLVDFKNVTGGEKTDRFNLNVSAATSSLQGGLGDDEFTLANEAIKTGVINGGGGIDTLRVTTGANTWTLTAAQTGDVNTNTFGGIEILAGGAGADIFDNKIAAHTLSLSAIDTGVLHASADVNNKAISVIGMNTVKNLAALEGFNDSQTWTLTGDAAGTVKTATNATLNFTDVAKLQGGSGNETFIVNAPVTQFSLDGGAGINTVQGTDSVNTWVFSAQTAGAVGEPVANTGKLNSSGLFANIQQLKGGTLADSLDLTGSSNLAVSLANITGFEDLIGGTNSSLTGANQLNNWQLNATTNNAVASGTINNSINFKNFSALTGGTGQDIFAVANSSQFKGSINGGINTSNTVRDELKIDSVVGTFDVTAQGVGTLDYTNTTTSTPTTITFTEIETLTGGSAADIFSVKADVDMVLNGGSGAAVDVINLPALNLDIALAAGGALPGINGLTLENFENIAADASKNNTLRAVDGEATWAINDKNSGTLTLTKNAQTSETKFSNFNNLVSGAGVNHFIFSDSGSIKTIVANDGDDLVGKAVATRWDVTTQLSLTDIAAQKVYAETVTGLKHYIGGDGNDEFNLAAATAVNNLAIEGGDGQNSLTSPAGSWKWLLKGSQQGELTLAAQKITFTSLQNLFASANQSLTTTASVDAWRITKQDQLTALINNDATQLNKFAQVSTGAADDDLDINAAYAGVINLEAGKNTVTLRAQGSIAGLAAGGGVDSITSQYTQSLWTLTEANNKRFISVTTGVPANTVIGELTGFDRLIVNDASVSGLVSTLDNSQWLITDAAEGSLTAPQISAIQFKGFKSLLGSDGKDTFSFANGSVFKGDIDGGKGDNLVDVSTGGQTNYQLNEAQGSEINGVKHATGVKGAGAQAQLTLASSNPASWVLNGENAGELTYAGTQKFSFEGFGILVGGSGADSFDLTAPAAKIIRIDGGAHPNNAVNSLTAKAQPNVWTLGAGTGGQDTTLATSSGTVYVGDFDRIESLTGAGTDKLVVAQGDTQWNLNANTGRLTHTLGTTSATFAFSGINTLLGSDGTDTYTLSASVQFAEVDGRGGENLVQLAAADAILDLTQGFAVQGVKNVTGVAGTGIDASLTLVANSNATWTLTGENAGTISVLINNQAKTISFAEFANLKGSENSDAFILQDDGFVSGEIKGGNGQNAITPWSGENASWVLDTVSSVTGGTNGLKQKFSAITQLNGSDKNDVFILASNQTATINAGTGDDTLRLATAARLLGQFNGGLDKNTVQAVDGINTWQLTTATSGAVTISGGTTNRVTFTEVGALVGGAGADTLNGFNTAASWDVRKTDGSIATGAQGVDKLNFKNMDTLVGGTQSDVFKVSNVFAGAIIGGDGSDTLELLEGGSVGSFKGGNSNGDTIVGPLDDAIWQLNIDKNTLKLADADGTLLIGDFQEVETLQANSDAEDALVSTLGDNIWDLTGPQSGRINNAISFTGFDKLKGSDLKDQFIFNFIGTFGKSIDADAGENIVQLNAVNSVALDWGNKNVNGVKGANKLIGSNTVDSELSLVSSVDLTWRIDRLDGGSISDGTTTFNFDQYKNIKGSAVKDGMTFINAGRISGSIDAGDGVDTLQGLNRDNNWQLGQTFSITAVGEANAYINNAVGFERLTGGTAKDTFALNARVKADINGSDGDDRLVLTTGSRLDGSFAGGNDKNSIESQLAASRWELASPANGVVLIADETVLRFSGANNLIATQNGDNQLSFANVSSSLVWAVNGGSGENASGQVEINGQPLLSTFSGFNRIVGGKAVDDITLSTALTDLNLGDGDNRLTLQPGAKVATLTTGKGMDELKSFAAANVWQMLNATQGKLTSAGADIIGQFTGIDVFTGSGSDRLIGAVGTNKWAIMGPGSGTLNSTFNFNAFARVQGNNGSDTFEFGPTGSIFAVEGGDGDDTLTARNNINQWSFFANDRGAINAPNEVSYVSFSGVESFTGALTASDIIQLDPQVTNVKLNAGGQVDDELIINYRDALTLSSDGTTWLGLGGLKKITAKALTANISAQLASTSSAPSRWTINEVNGGDWAAGTANIHFSGFDKIQGGAAADEFILAGGRIQTLIDGGNQLGDSLATENKNTIWTITGSGAGSLTYVDDVNNPPPPPVQSFAGIETLIGNALSDQYRLLADGITINIRGGNGAGVDKVFFNGALDITLGQQDVVGVGIAEIEFFNANSNTQNTLHSSAEGGIWTLTDINSGRLVSGTETLEFTNFQNLRGGKGDDQFDLNEKARVTGVLSGGDGNNTLTLRHNHDLIATLTADGAGDLSSALAIARFESINTLRVASVGPSSSTATLTAANQTNHWAVTDDKVVLNEFNYSGFTNVNGNDGIDDFVLSGKQTLGINGKNGADSLTVKSKKDTQVAWQITNVFGRVDTTTGGASGTVEISVPGFSNIEQLIGGDGNDVFVLNDTTGSYTRFDGAAGSNSLTTLTANNQWQLGALTDDDEPVLDHLNAAEFVRIQSLTGAGNDALLGSDDANLWQLLRGGNLSLAQTTATQNRALTASGIGRIKGGKGQDDFVLQEAGIGSFARIDGGEVGVDIGTGVNTSSVRDSLNATALSSDVQVRLDAFPLTASVAPNQLVVSGVETIQLKAANNNSLYGPTLAEKQAINWQIAQQKQGSFAPKSGANGENTVTFSGVNNIIAGAGEDHFALASFDAIGGEVGGGELDGGEGIDFLDYSQAALSATQSNFDVVIGENTRLKNIEGVIGKNTASMRLVVKGASSQWLLDDIDGEGTTSDGVNDGRVTLANGKGVDFVDFASLVGTQGADIFDIKGSLNGTITTGDGVDSILVSVRPNRAQAIKLNNDTNDSLDLSWQGVPPTGVKETYKQVANGRESIALDGLAQPFSIDFTALGSINDRLAVDEMRVQTAFETAGNNRVTLAQNALQLVIDSAGAVKTGTWFNVENKTNLVLSGQAGDQLSLSGKTQLAGSLTLEKFAISSLAEPNREQSLAAGQINFNSVAGIGSEQKPVVISTPQVQFNNLRADAWVKSTSDIKLASLDGQGNLNLSADGQIGQTQLLTYARELTLKASGSITLDNPDNRLTGGLSLESANNIVLANGLTQINNARAENLKITGQDLTFTGPIVVAGTTDLASTGSINAVNTANHLARVQLNATGTVKLAAGADSSLIGAKVGGALQMQADGLTVAGDVTAASLDLNAGQTNAGQPTAGRGQLKVSGQLNAPDITLTAGDILLKNQLQGGQLTLHAATVTIEKPLNLLGDFTAEVGTLSQSGEAVINAKGAVEINATGALQLDGAIASQQSLQITAGGAIQQSGAWTTNAATAGGQTKPASSDILVKAGSNIIQQPAASTQSAGAITYEAAGNIRLSALSAKGAVVINAAGSIEDANGPAANVTASSAELFSGGNINGLDLAVDSLVGQFAGTGSTITLRNEKTLRIDRLVADGAVTISATRGDVIFNNDASKNPAVANMYTTDLAREKTGVVNTNFTTGALNIVAEKGRVKATGPVNISQPDIVANTVNIFSALGVSTPGRPLVIYGNTVLYTGTGLNWKPFTAFGHRFTFTSDNALDLSQLLLAAGDQLIEVEPLEDVNPAVFTDVRNYSADNISIMLPADQRYEE